MCLIFDAYKHYIACQSEGTTMEAVYMLQLPGYQHLCRKRIIYYIIMSKVTIWLHMQYIIHSPIDIAMADEFFQN